MEIDMSGDGQLIKEVDMMRSYTNNICGYDSRRHNNK
jgi:hypothetical protein